LHFSLDRAGPLPLASGPETRRTRQRARGGKEVTLVAKKKATKKKK
jgi:hypothetical protein